MTTTPENEQQAGSRTLGWKVLGGLLLTLIAIQIGVNAWGVGVTQIGRLLGFPDTLITTLSLGGIIAINILGWSLATHLILKRRLREIAFRLHRGWWLDLVAGCVITALALSAVFALETRIGWLAVNGWMWQEVASDIWLVALWGSLLSSIGVGIVDETGFRGYLLTGLSEAWGQRIGLLVMALVFALPHAISYSEAGIPPAVLPFTLLLPALAAVIMGWLYFQTRSLWLPIGIHFAWDMLNVDLFNMAGEANQPHLFGAVTRLQGPAWLGSTVWGNAVLMDLLGWAIVVGLGLLWLQLREKPHPMQNQRVSGEVPTTLVMP